MKNDRMGIRISARIAWGIGFVAALTLVELDAATELPAEEELSQPNGYEVIFEAEDGIPYPMAGEEESADWLESLRVLVRDLQSQQVLFDEEEALQLLSRSLLEWIDPEGGEFTAERSQRIRQRRQGHVYDPGFELTISDQYLRIGPFRSDAPAETQEFLQEGLRVLEINGQDVTRKGLYHSHDLLRANEPLPLPLVIRDADDQVVTQTIERVATRLADFEEEEILPLDLGYLKVNRLRESSGQTIAERFRGWAERGLHGGVLDLRGADGDDLESVKEIASLFVDEHTFLFAYRDQADQDLIVMEAEAGHVLGKPVMVLIDAETGGAAEVLAAVLQDSVRGAMLFGQPSRGDFLLRSRVELSGGMALYLPTRRLVTGSGMDYDGSTGVRPDVRTGVTDRAFRAKRSGRTERIEEEVAQEELYHRIRGDAALRRAVDVLLGLKALDVRPYGTTSNHSR